MANPAEQSLLCPHCRKTFSAGLLGTGTARAGYKCTHCKLFVPLERTDEPQPENAAA